MRVGDPVQFECVQASGFKLNTAGGNRGWQPHSGQPWFEVFASQEATSFKVHRYRSAVESLTVLLSGLPVRLMHKEADGFLGARHEADLTYSYIGQGPLSSSNYIWQLESANLDGSSKREGNSITWDTALRLRHIGSNKLLCVQMQDGSLSTALVPPEQDGGGTWQYGGSMWQ